MREVHSTYRDILISPKKKIRKICRKSPKGYALSQRYWLIYVSVADENTQGKTRKRGKVQWHRVSLVRFVERNIVLQRFIIAREEREMVFALFISARKRRYPRINSRAMALKCGSSPPEGKYAKRVYTALFRAVKYLYAVLYLFKGFVRYTARER